MNLFCLRVRDRSPRRRHRPLVVLAALALLLAACFGDGADEIQAQAGGEPADDEYPEWIDKLYPPPGSELSATQAVQVDHKAIAADRQVRLILDGTDVTTYAVATTPGLLEYDIDQAQAPIELGPGEHTAVVQLTRVTPGSGEGADSFESEVHETIESFTWTFTVL